MKAVSRFYFFLVFLFLYAPLLVMLVFSFNASNSTGIFTGFLMSFTYSLDDFVITYFTRGASFQTLSVQIYTMTHQRISPKVNALSALLFVAVIIIMVAINIKDRREEKAAESRRV